MKQGSSQQRRGRSRGNSGKRNNSGNRSHTMESNGPDGKVRGNAQQILDKYQSLARDAATSGEHIAAEGFFQYAEHYQRVLNTEQANNPNQNQNQNQNRGQNQKDENKASDNDGGKNSDNGSQAPVAEEQAVAEAETVSEDASPEVVEETKSEDSVNDSGEDDDAESELAASA